MAQSATPAAITAARKRPVWVTAQAAMNPPWLHPAMPSRSGSATPLATRSSRPARMSVHSPCPTAPATAAANSWPCPWLPRGLGWKTAKPAAASHWPHDHQPTMSSSAHRL